MNIKQLKEAIANLPDEMEVIMQRDSEGNGYSPLSCVDNEAVYLSDTTWSGDVYFMEWGAKGSCKTKKEWEEIKAKPRSLILVPVN